MMKKTFALLSIYVLSAMAIYAQPDIPSGYESIYGVVGETALAPDTADGVSTLKLLGPSAGWNADIYDFTGYNYLDVKLRFHAADTGKQVAFRYYAGSQVVLDTINLPLGIDTTYVYRINVQDYAREDDSVKFGGIWLYNGSTHWSFSYPGEPATEATIVEYVAIKKKPVMPAGWVSLYSLKPDYEKAPYVVGAQATYQLSGPGANWDKVVSYDITNYDTLAIKITYFKADIGKEVVVRFAVNASGSVNKLMVALPDVADTTLTIKIGLADYVGGDGKVGLGGLLFYNGSSHWSITYTDPATLPTRIDYVALKTLPVQGIAIAAEDTVQSQNLPFDLSTQLMAVFDPINATNQAVIWSSADTNRATVDGTGLVTAKSLPGDVVIAAKSVEDTNYAATYTVKITGAKVDASGVALASDTVDVKIHFDGSVEYTVQPENASLTTVIWMTSDTNIAIVNESGLITAVAEGYAKIIVTTDDGGFKDSCVIHVIGYRDIPLGYESLYTLVFDEAGTLKGLDTLSTFPGADVPGMFDTDKDNTGSLLGTQYNWNRYNKYVDVSAYPELVVAATFKTEDVGKSVRFRYAFSTSAEDVSSGSVITNRDVTIDQEDMLFVIDLDNDTADIDDLKHLGAIKFQDNPERLDLVVDYVALKKAGGLSNEARLSGIKLNDVGLFGFSADTYTYNFNVKLESITVTATAMDGNATVAITDDGNIDLSGGDVTVTITVVAEDGTTQDYTLNIKGTTSVQDILEPGITLYPTISNGSFNIEFARIPGSITVFDLTGNIVMQETVHDNHHKIDLNPGLYLIKLESNGVNKIVKVVCTYR